MLQKKSEKKAKSEYYSDEEPKSYLTNVKKLLHSLFSNCEVYFNKTMVYNADGLYPQKEQISNELIYSSVSDKGILACHEYNFEDFRKHWICTRSLIQQIPQEQ